MVTAPWNRTVAVAPSAVSVNTSLSVAWPLTTDAPVIRREPPANSSDSSSRRLLIVVFRPVYLMVGLAVTLMVTSSAAPGTTFLSARLGSSLSQLNRSLQEVPSPAPVQATLAG